VGDPIELVSEQVMSDIHFLNEAAEFIDTSAAGRFAITASSLPEDVIALFKVAQDYPNRRSRKNV